MTGCQAITLKGAACSRSGAHTSTVSGKHLCTQHLNVEAKARVIVIKDVWAELGLVTPSKKLTQKALNKLKRKLGNTTSDRGGEGSIYVYSIASEAGSNYYKVGMTEKEADERLAEWAKTHKARILKKCVFKVEKNVKLIERIIHLYLDYCRMYRTPTNDNKEKLFRSVYKVTGEIIDDEQNKKIGKDKRLVANNKFVEWFHAPITDIKTVIESVVNVFGK